MRVQDVRSAALRPPARGLRTAAAATWGQRLAVMRGGGGDQAGGGIAYIQDQSASGVGGSAARTFSAYDNVRNGPIVNTSNQFQNLAYNWGSTNSSSNPYGTTNGGQILTKSLLFSRFFFNTAFAPQAVNLVLTDSGSGSWSSSGGVTTSSYTGYASGDNQYSMASAFVFAAAAPCVTARQTGLSWIIDEADTLGEAQPILSVADNAKIAAGAANATATGWTPLTRSNWAESWTSATPRPLTPSTSSAPSLQFLGWTAMSIDTDGASPAIQNIFPSMQNLGPADFWEILIVLQAENPATNMGFELRVVESSSQTVYASNSSGTAATIVDFCDANSNRLRPHLRSSNGFMPYGCPTYDATAGAFLPVSFG
jgi:hypothetical protein